MNTKRLTLATLAALAATMAIGTAQAQQAAKVFRVGALFNRVPGPEFELLKRELARLGYAEGKNIAFEARFAEVKLDRLPGFAAELAAMNVDVIATYGGPPTAAARKATTAIPIVAALVATRLPLAPPQRSRAPAETSRELPTMTLCGRRDRWQFSGRCIPSLPASPS